MMVLRRSGNRWGRATADVVRLRARGLALLMALLLMVVPLLPPGARARTNGAALGHATVVTSLRVVPSRPRLLYTGGYGSLPVFPGTGGPACVRQLAVSADAGTSWRTLPNGQVIDRRPPYAYLGCSPGLPIVAATDGVNIFKIASSPNCGSVYSCGSGLFHSADGGRTWSQPLQKLEGSGYPYSSESGLSLSLAAPGRAYAIISTTQVGGGTYHQFVARSDDGGGRWHVVADDATRVDGQAAAAVGLFAETVPDPAAKDRVYLGLSTYEVPLPSRWLRSEDGGRSWHRLLLPVDPGPPPPTDADFTKLPVLRLSFDPHLTGALVLDVVNVPVPADQRWVSLDHGTTWKQIACPGDLRGTCPTYTLDNVFGAGRAYGIYADGVHAFAGTGLAGPRLSLSDRLPCRGADLLDAGGGAHAGDPAYLLCQASKGQRTKLSAMLPVHSDTTRVGTLYRSTDGGASWRKLDPAVGW